MKCVKSKFRSQQINSEQVQPFDRFLVLFFSSTEVSVRKVLCVRAPSWRCLAFLD
jgi:hypothetical protein